MNFLRKSGSLLAVSTAARNSFCSRDRSRGTNFAATRFCETIVRGIPRSSSNSPTVNCRFSLIAARTLSTFSGVLLVEGLPGCPSLSTDSQPSFEASVQQFYLNFTHWFIPKRLLNHWNGFHGQMSKFEAKLDADSLICSLGHCESDGRTVHKLHQRRPTNDWLAPWESDCSRVGRKVSSDWLPSYIKVTRPVLEILNMAGCFPDRPRKTTVVS